MRLVAENLSARYGKTPVLGGVCCSLPSGAVTVVIGANGAGKSTLLRGLAGLTPVSGAVRIDGAPCSPAARRDSVAYMPQDTSASSSLTLTEVVLLGRLGALGFSIPGRVLAEAEAMLARFGLSRLAHRRLDEISGGQRQLTFLAQALIRRPRVLLLDEPTAALDLRHQLIVLEAVRESAASEGMAVAVALHDLSLAAAFGDAVLCLHKGAVEAAGPPDAILTAERIGRLYGVEAEVVLSPHGRRLIAPYAAAER